jgi:predicted lactoylglutathione lyase
MARQIYLNLSVHDLEKTKAFFSKLGFDFNAKFTDANAACMIISEDAYVMLLGEPFFQGFMTNAICDTATHTEALIALSCASRAEVDDLVHRAIAAGGRSAMPAMDRGFMYSWSFYDLDGHHWELVWMDPKAAE